MTFPAFTNDREIDRERIAEALRALSWAVADMGMSPLALRRGLEELDTFARGPSSAMDALVEAHRVHKSQITMEFEK